MDVYPAFDATCNPALMPYAYNDAFLPTVPIDGYFVDSADALIGADVMDQDAASDGASFSDSGSYMPVPDTNDDHIFGRIKEEMMAAARNGVSQCDLDALELASNDEPHHPVKKARGKTNLASLTEEERLLRRRKKNREAAQLSRYRKRAKLDDLERRLDIQKSVNSNLMNEREVMRGETMRLRNEVDYLKSVLAKSLAVAQLFGANVKTEPEVPRSFVLSVH